MSIISFSWFLFENELFLFFIHGVGPGFIHDVLSDQDSIANTTIHLIGEWVKFKDSGIEILFALWFAKADFLNLKNSIMQDILKRFAAEGIEIPFPTRTLHVADHERGLTAADGAKQARAARTARR